MKEVTVDCLIYFCAEKSGQFSNALLMTSPTWNDLPPLEKGFEELKDRDLRFVPKKGQVRRLIILDAANLMYGGADGAHNQGRQEGSRPDVLALLSVMRYFVVNDFEVIAVSSHKYLKDETTNFKLGLSELKEEGLFRTVPAMNLDDVMGLVIADWTNGIVISADKYRDHCQAGEYYEKVVRAHLCDIKFKVIPPQNRNTISVDDRHFIASKTFKLIPGGNVPISKFFFCDESETRYELSVERRRKGWSSQRREKVLKLLNDLISSGVMLSQGLVE
ncbi:unnamed protein product [Caenorhabditis auriculariae]|uniref:RNase NYN domain-containing protein n=1 Tax=Caenorhabditis auriculariae TaxID=2777116 RepID=A0A8S1HTN4_9PELO|nr:unnamed protein product [Caenorhabditis auriculariae]